MSKLRADSAWSKLTAEQREMLAINRGRQDPQARKHQRMNRPYEKARISGYFSLFRDISG
jgi:hypothetical protein